VLYLYALSDAPARLPRGVRAIVIAGACAIVAEREAGEPSIEAAVEHDRVVRAIRADAVLPMRFGVSFDDERALRAELRPLKRAIAGALARVRECVQLTVRVSGKEAPLKGGPGTRYLARKAVPELAPLVRALRELVQDTRIERKRAGESFAVLYILVARSDVARVKRVVRATALEGIALMLTGPWPPYAFASLE
jgi:hypothetical protein